MKLHLRLNWHGIEIFTRTIDMPSRVWEGMVVNAKRGESSDLYNFSIQHLVWLMPEPIPPEPGSNQFELPQDEYTADAFPFGLPCRAPREVVMKELQSMGWKKVDRTV